MKLAALCGMSESEFWDSTPRYMAAKVFAYEQGQQTAWEQTRYISFHAIKAADGKNRIKKPSDLGKFPWERPKPRKLTKTDIEQLNKFDNEADDVLKKTNPAAYEAYINAKNAKSNS